MAAWARRRPGCYLLTAPPPPEPTYDWQPTPEELARLGPEGKRFLDDALAKYQFNFVAGWMVILMAETIDQLRAYREHIDTHGVMLTGRGGSMKVNPIVREHLKALRWLGQLRKWLDLRS